MPTCHRACWNVVFQSVFSPLINGVIPKPRAFTSGARDLARSSCEFRLVDVAPALRQILPVRIHGFNQFYLLAASPPFDFFFASYCSVRVHKALVVHKASEVVTTSESRSQFVLVLPRATRKIAGDSRVQHVRTRAIGHDVDVEAFSLPHCLLLPFNWTHVCDG